MNKVILMGRLTRDPEVRYSAAGQAVCRYSLAVNRIYKREGEPDADFINIVAFGNRGEFAGKYFRKGQMVAVCGELRTGSYEKDGVRHYTTDVIVSDQYFTGSKPAGEATPEASAPAADASGFTPVDPETAYDDDVPF